MFYFCINYLTVASALAWFLMYGTILLLIQFLKVICLIIETHFVIALAPAAYKLYCKLLNRRLSQWIDDNNGLADEQNGFRKGRSIVDQIAPLTNI